MKCDFTGQDFHCMARLLQSQLFHQELLESCNYCKYLYECCKPKTLSNLNKIRKKLQEETGVYLGIMKMADSEFYSSWQLLYPERLDAIIGLLYPEGREKEKEKEYQKMKEEIKKIQEQKDIYQQFLKGKG